MGIVIRQSIRGSIVNYIGAFIGFLTTMFVVTKFLSPEDYGLLNVILYVAIFFASFVQLGTNMSIARFFPYFRDKEKNHNGFFFYITALPFIGCLIFIPIYLLLKEPIITFFDEDTQLFAAYFYWVIPLTVFWAYWAVFEAYSKANMKIVFPKTVREIIYRALIIAVYLLYGLHVIDRKGAVSFYVIVCGIAMLIMLFYVSRIAPTSLKYNFSFIDKPLRKDIRNYTGILMLGTLGGSILGRMDLFIISSELGFKMGGIYVIALALSALIEIPARAITAISAPIAATAMRENNLHKANQLYKKVALNQMIVGGLIFVLIWINIDSIFKIIPNGEIYAQGKWVVFFIGLARLINVKMNFGGILVSFSKYYHWKTIFTFVVTAVGIAANYLLIPIFGISGSAIAVLITVILTCAFQQWIVWRKLNGNPYTKGTLKMILIIPALLGINHFLPTFGNPFIDLAFRSSIIGIIALSAIHFGKVSDDMSGVLRKVLREEIRQKK